MIYMQNSRLLMTIQPTDCLHQQWFTSIAWLKTVRCPFIKWENGSFTSTIFVVVDDVFSFPTSDVENDR